MKDFIKILLAVIPLIKELMNGIKKAKDEKQKQKVLKIINDELVDDFNKLIRK